MARLGVTQLPYKGPDAEQNGSKLACIAPGFRGAMKAADDCHAPKVGAASSHQRSNLQSVLECAVWRFAPFLSRPSQSGMVAN